MGNINFFLKIAAYTLLPGLVTLLACPVQLLSLLVSLKLCNCAFLFLLAKSRYVSLSLWSAGHLGLPLSVFSGQVAAVHILFFFYAFTGLVAATFYMLCFF